MGDLAFDIIKDVDLNKTVTLDIDKTVDVNVNNPDQLATAEADAEAFGSNALAETDAYTYVSERSTGGDPIEVDVDALGNTTLTEQSNFNVPVDLDLDGDGVPDYFLPENITVNFDTPDNTGLPDIDDLNWTDGLSTNESAGPDESLPLLGEFEAIDKNLTYLNTESVTVEDNDSVVITARYTLDDPGWRVDFGPRTVVDITGTVTDTQDLSIEVPPGTNYLVEFLDEDGDGSFDAKEYEFFAFEDGQNAEWVFGGQSSDVDVYVQDGEEIFDLGFGDWAFQALGTIEINGIEDGEAFSYAESTSALDLNVDVTDVL